MRREVGDWMQYKSRFASHEYNLDNAQDVYRESQKCHQRSNTLHKSARGSIVS